MTAMRQTADCYQVLTQKAARGQRVVNQIIGIVSDSIVQCRGLRLDIGLTLIAKWQPLLPELQ